MADSQKIFDSYIIAIDGQKLSIRASKKAAVAAMLLGIVFIIVGVGMAYKMLTVPSSDWTLRGEETGRMYPLAQHPIGDRIATFSFIFLFWGCFFVAGSAAAVASLRMMLRCWLFDKDAGVATLGRRNWPLDQIRALRLKADMLLVAPLGVSLMIELASGKQVRVMRGMISKTRTLQDLQAILEPVAQQMAQWLAVPLKLCAKTGWRLDDLPERSTTGFVPAASTLHVQEVEEIELQAAPPIDTPAWLQRPAPRRVRRRWHTVLLSVLGWCVIVVPLVAILIWVGARFRDAQSMRTTSGQAIGLFRDDRHSRHGVCFQFAVDGQSYTNWDYNVSAELWTVAQKRGATIEVSYLPSDPSHSNIDPLPPVQLLPENWPAWAVVLIAYALVALVVAMRLRTDAKRISGVVSLGERGRMSQGMVLRRAQTAGRTRTPVRVLINGIPVHKLWQSVENDPNQLRYEFVVEGTKRSGYVPVDLLGHLRPDGLIGVVYDPHNPELHAALPEIERCVTFV